MRRYLLDTNLLIALLWPSHAQHAVARRWFASRRKEGWATCPFTQAGFVRITSNPAFSRDAAQPRTAMDVLTANTACKDHVFWADDIPFREAVAFAGFRLLGHQQVTDAYLVGLALHRGGILATLDQRIVELTEPKSDGRNAIETVR